MADAAACADAGPGGAIGNRRLRVGAVGARRLFAGTAEVLKVFKMLEVFQSFGDPERHKENLQHDAATDHAED